MKQEEAQAIVARVLPGATAQRAPGGKCIIIRDNQVVAESSSWQSVVNNVGMMIASSEQAEESHANEKREQFARFLEERFEPDFKEWLARASAVVQSDGTAPNPS